MPSCLGLYIEQNLIKYAKVSKSNEVIKVESFGVKFYEDINVAIKQIVEETYSFKVPISINTTDEIYNEIEAFSLLSRKDIEDVIGTEFENICFEKNVNKNIYEQRYLFTNLERNNEKVKTIHIATPKTSIEQRKNQFSDYKVTNITPISVSIERVLKKTKKETALIVNIEKNTTITKVSNGRISKIDIIENGSKEILDKINQKENSYSKSYEICKNSTIYTEADKDLQYEENEYLEDIMPTLFQIVSQVRTMIEQSTEIINKVYITGTGAVVNNIDIYFQNYLNNITCEILKPSFISNNSKINIKDYIEVNSAISLALYALEKDNDTINFLKKSGFTKVWEILNSNIGDTQTSELSRNISEFLEKFSKQYNFICTTTTMLLVLYIVGSCLLNNQLNSKITETENSISNTQKRIAQVEEYNQKFVSLKGRYETLIRNIENMNNSNSEDKRYKKAIPNLLNNIMTVIPTNVQLTSIENTSDTHVVIKAKSKHYEELAYFKTKLKVEKILENVVSDTGSASGGYLSVTIEGELP